MIKHRTDTERLDWVLMNGPEFNEGFLRVWHGTLAADRLGLSDGGGYYLAEGDTKREQIDAAMDGNLSFLE